MEYKTAQLLRYLEDQEAWLRDGGIGFTDDEESEPVGEDENVIQLAPPPGWEHLPEG